MQDDDDDACYRTAQVRVCQLLLQVACATTEHACMQYSIYHTCRSILYDDPYFACIVCMTESSRKRRAVVSFKNLQHPCAAPGVAYIDVATRATSNK